LERPACSPMFPPTMKYSEMCSAKAQQDEPKSIAGDVALGSVRLLGQLSRMIDNRIDEGSKLVHVEGKLLLEIREKKRELGLRL